MTSVTEVPESQVLKTKRELHLQGYRERTNFGALNPKEFRIKPTYSQEKEGHKTNPQGERLYSFSVCDP
jgi:hypothetical protein